jgi:DNA-binding LacI/PurR family transcriptional regulator
MLTRMADTGKPIALVDNEDKGGELISAVSRRNIVAYTFAAGSRAGYLTGKHLIAEGHRHAAYITSRDGISWSENRFAGLQRAFNAYNISGNLHRYSVDVTRAAPEILRAGQQAKQFVGLLAGTLEPAPRDSIVESRLYELENHVAWFLRDTTRMRSVSPLLQEALRRREITAWVAENDVLAAACLDFLRDRAIAVPERIDIIGFDDSQMAICRSLTSYNFNMPALAGKIMMQLLYPFSCRGARGAKHHPIEVDGFVSKRIPRAIWIR